jgi:hypothetical protein
MSEEADKLVRAMETGAVLTLGVMVVKVIFSWVFQKENLILLLVLFGINWVHNLGTGRSARVEKVNAFPTTSVTVSDVTYQKPSEAPDYFVATVRNGGPARIYDVSLSCNMRYQVSADRETNDKVTTHFNLGYINPGETARLRLNANGSGLLMMENIRVESCSPNFTPEITDMLKLGRVQ